MLSKIVDLKNLLIYQQNESKEQLHVRDGMFVSYSSDIKVLKEIILT